MDKGSVKLRVLWINIFHIFEFHFTLAKKRFIHEFPRSGTIKEHITAEKFAYPDRLFAVLGSCLGKVTRLVPFDFDTENTRNQLGREYV
jgi:hypothetical protein